MRLGALFGLLGSNPSPTALAEQAKGYAGEGFESLWVPQAVGRGFIIADPFLTLGIAATVTDDIELGTAILQIPLYDPVDLAHRTLSLMQVCGERLTLGVGAGSTKTDFTAYGKMYDQRFTTFNRTLSRLKSLLAGNATPTANLTPWPNVRGCPSILLGTWGASVDRAATEFDGWVGSSMYRTYDELVQSLERYRAAGGKRAVVSTIRVGPGDDVGETKEKLQAFAGAGFDDAVVFLQPGGPAPSEVRSLLV